MHVTSLSFHRSLIITGSISYGIFEEFFSIVRDVSFGHGLGACLEQEEDGLKLMKLPTLQLGRPHEVHVVAIVSRFEPRSLYY